jgi:hypothetical protein
MRRNRDLPPVVYVVEESVPQMTKGKPIDFAERDLWEWLQPPFRGWKPIRAFASRAAAEDYCRDLEVSERGLHNPFTWGQSLDEITSLDAPRLHDWLLDTGLAPPEIVPVEPAGPDEPVETPIFQWIAWWEKAAPDMSDAQRERVFAAADKVRLFRVVEMTE